MLSIDDMDLGRLHVHMVCEDPERTYRQKDAYPSPSQADMWIRAGSGRYEVFCEKKRFGDFLGETPDGGFFKILLCNLGHMFLAFGHAETSRFVSLSVEA